MSPLQPPFLSHLPLSCLWCLLTCDAFRDLPQLPFLHQILLEYEKDVLDIMPCCTPPPSVYCKKKNHFTSTFCGLNLCSTHQHRAQAKGRWLSESTARVCKVFQGRLSTAMWLCWHHRQCSFSNLFCWDTGALMKPTHCSSSLVLPFILQSVLLLLTYHLNLPFLITP